MPMSSASVFSRFTAAADPKGVHELVRSSASGILSSVGPKSARFEQEWVDGVSFRDVM